jgi:peptidoglycan hydrolase CwlO-like protein
VKSDVKVLKEDVKRIEGKVDKIDAEFEVLNSSLLSTQADVHRLKKVL